MKSSISYILNESHSFKDFKDPWAVMSPEDRKEANRLFIAAMKVMPSSPRQKELHAKLMVLYKKYNIGVNKEEQSVKHEEPKKTYSQLISEISKTVNWVRPKIATLKQEYEIEYKKHLIHEVGNVFPTVQSFLDAAKNGIVREITKSHDHNIGNRSNTKSMKQLLSLIKTYRSYPKYRNEDTLNAMKEAMLSGKPMDMPIIVRERNTKDIGKNDRVFAGNTRMDMAFMHGLKVKALIIFLPEGVKL